MKTSLDDATVSERRRRPHPVTNQFAAMRSLRIGWALLVAVVLIRSARSRWRWLWIAHPLPTTLVVVPTANHYWLDGVAAALLDVGVIVLVTIPTDRGVLAAREATDQIDRADRPTATRQEATAAPPPPRTAFALMDDLETDSR